MVGTVAGCALHVQGYTLPAPELAIALTVAVAAAVVAMRAKLPVGLLAALLAVAGVFHGYAYGESIVGAETAPLAAYMVGFGVIQSCVAVGSALALRAVVGRNSHARGEGDADGGRRARAGCRGRPRQRGFGRLKGGRACTAITTTITIMTTSTARTSPRWTCACARSNRS